MLPMLIAYGDGFDLDQLVAKTIKSKYPVIRVDGDDDFNNIQELCGNHPYGDTLKGNWSVVVDNAQSLKISKQHHEWIHDKAHRDNGCCLVLVFRGSVPPAFWVNLNAKMIHFESLAVWKGEEWIEWIDRTAKSLGLELDPKVQLIVSIRCGLDKQTIWNELRKLQQVLKGPVGLQEVSGLLVDRMEGDPYGVAPRALQGDLKGCLNVIGILYRFHGDAGMVRLAHTLLWQFYDALWVRDLIGEMDVWGITKTTPLKYPTVSKLAPIVRNRTPLTLLRCSDKIARMARGFEFNPNKRISIEIAVRGVVELVMNPPMDQTLDSRLR